MTHRVAPSIHRKGKPEPVSHDEIAGEALTFLAAEPERLRRFLDITGLRVETLRAAAAASGFAASLIDYIAADERCLLDFAAACGRDPADIAALRARLSPPSVEN